MQATFYDGIDQPRALAGQAQGRFRQACPLQGEHVFAGDFRPGAGADERLVELEQRVIRRTGAGQGVAQGQAAGGIVRLGRHQLAGATHGFLGLAGVGLGQGQAQLQVGIARVAFEGLAVDLDRRVPALQIAVGMGGGGQRLDRQHPATGLGFIDIHHLGVEAGPAGDLQVVADQPGVQALGRHLAQMAQGWRIAAGAGVENQAVVRRVGKGQGRPQQLAA